MSPLPSDNFARHGGFRAVYQCFTTEGIYFDAQLILHEFDGLATRQTIASNDCGGMNFHFDQFVGPSKELRGNYNDRSRSIADFLVLLLGEVNKYPAGWMLDF